MSKAYRVTKRTAKTEKEANAKLIQSLVPSFTPSFKLVKGKRIYDQMYEKITLVKYNGTIPADSTVETPDNSEDPGTSEGDGGGSLI